MKCYVLRENGIEDHLSVYGFVKLFTIKMSYVVPTICAMRFIKFLELITQFVRTAYVVQRSRFNIFSRHAARTNQTMVDIRGYSLFDT